MEEWCEREQGVDWRETLEWRSAENHPRIIQHIKRLALKFCSQHFHSLDLRLYCWVAKDNSTLRAYSAVFCCRLSSRISDACHWYTCSLKRWWKSKLASFQGADESQNAPKYFFYFLITHNLQSAGTVWKPLCGLRLQLKSLRIWGYFGRKSHSEPNPSKLLTATGIIKLRYDSLPVSADTLKRRTGFYPSTGSSNTKLISDKPR